MALALPLQALSSMWIARAMPPLEAMTFQPGSFVIPMDDKQFDRIGVYGLLHAILRRGCEIFRIIQPPDVFLRTNLHPGGEVFRGGVVIVEQRFENLVNQERQSFPDVSVERLSMPFSTTRAFRINHPTKILRVVGTFGHTDETLSRMGIPFDELTKSDLAINPKVVWDYTLIVIDCPGWGGYIPDQVASELRARAKKGGEIIFTDIALEDLDRVFPNYVKVGRNYAGVWPARIHNPPAPNFDSEYPSQGWIPPPDPGEIMVYTYAHGRVVYEIAEEHRGDVRILADSDSYGPAGRYAVLAFYFEYGEGLVMGLALHPQDQSISQVGEKGYYAVHAFYGNKFVHGPPPPDFVIKCSPPSATVNASKSVSYTVTIQSISGFNETVHLSLGGLPSAASSSFSPPSVAPPPGGSAQSILTISTTEASPIGTFDLEVIGRSGDIVHSCPIKLAIVALIPDFALSVDPNYIELNRGESATASITVGSKWGFASNVSLSASGLPSGLEASFNPPIVNPGGAIASSTLLIKASLTAEAGLYTIGISGSGPSSTRYSSITVRVLPPKDSGIILPLMVMIIALSAILPMAFFARRRRGPRAARGPPLYGGRGRKYPILGATPIRGMYRLWVSPEALKRLREDLMYRRRR